MPFDDVVKLIVKIEQQTNEQVKGEKEDAKISR